MGTIQSSPSLMILRWPHLHGIGRSRLSSLLVGQEISVHNFFCQDVDPLWVKIAIKYFKWGQYWRGWNEKLAWKGTVGQLLWVEGPGEGGRKKKSNTATPCSLQVSYKMERAKDKQLM